MPAVVGVLFELVFAANLVQLNLHVSRVVDWVDLESILARDVWLVFLIEALSRHIFRLFQIVDAWL